MPHTSSEGSSYQCLHSLAVCLVRKNADRPREAPRQELFISEGGAGLDIKCGHLRLIIHKSSEAND